MNIDIEPELSCTWKLLYQLFLYYISYILIKSRTCVQSYSGMYEVSSSILESITCSKFIVLFPHSLLQCVELYFVWMFKTQIQITNKLVSNLVTIYLLSWLSIIYSKSLVAHNWAFCPFCDIMKLPSIITIVTAPFIASKSPKTH